MAVKYELRAITGKYTDRDGNEKNSYQTIGKVVQTKKGGFMLKLDSVPVGWDGWAYLQEPQPKEPRQEAPRNAQGVQAGGFDGMDDSIPF